MAAQAAVASAPPGSLSARSFSTSDARCCAPWLVLASSATQCFATCIWLSALAMERRESAFAACTCAFAVASSRISTRAWMPLHLDIV